MTMDLRFPMALLGWTRDHNQYLAQQNLGWLVSPDVTNALRQLKTRLVAFNRDYRGAAAWIRDPNRPLGAMRESFPAKLAADALAIVEEAEGLRPHLKGEYWDRLRRLFDLPAVQAPWTLCALLRRDGEMQKLLTRYPGAAVTLRGSSGQVKLTSDYGVRSHHAALPATRLGRPFTNAREEAAAASEAKALFLVRLAALLATPANWPSRSALPPEAEGAVTESSTESHPVHALMARLMDTLHPAERELLLQHPEDVLAYLQSLSS